MQRLQLDKAIPHELATLFPPMSESQLASLTEDIRRFGLRTSIIVHEGKILDGVQREKACRAAHVEARYVDYEMIPKSSLDGGPLAFVVSENLHRRHLTASQLRKLHRKLVPLIEKELEEQAKRNEKLFAAANNSRQRPNKGKSRSTAKHRAIKQVAKMTGSHQATVYRNIGSKPKPDRKPKDLSEGLTRDSSLRSLFTKTENNGGELYVEVGNYGLRCRRLTCE